MRNAFLWFVCSFSMVFHTFATAQTNEDGMTLLGMSEFQELRRPFYIAALYADTPISDPKLLLESQGRARMELRVSAERWSMRRFSSQWTRSIFVNNSQERLLRFDDSFVQFNSLLNRPFVRGDIIIVDGYPDGTSIVRVNGIEAMKVHKPGFFQLLLSKWIGSKPPTTEFRNNMLSNTADVALMSRFEALQPDASRTAALETFFAGGVAGVRLSDEEDDAAVDSEVVAVAQAPAPKPQSEPAKPTKATSVASAPKPKPVKPKPAPVVIEPEPEDMIDPELYAKQQEILTALYQNSVVKRILKNVQYPARALARDQQDRIQVSVIVDRRGNITSTSFTKESKYKLLNKAALSAIEETGKMPPVPPGLDGKSVTVLVPFSFILK